MLHYLREKYHPLVWLRKQKWFRRTQTLVDFPITAKVGVIRLKVYWLRDISFLLLGENLEAQTSACLSSLLEQFKPDLFIDIGANIGFYSWRAKNLDENLDVWMFEPDKSNAILLRKTIELNNLRGVKLFEQAVTDRSGIHDFLVDPISGKTGSVVDRSDNATTLHAQYGLNKHEKVNAITLDSLLNEMPNKRVLIKVDVEGAEDKVLQGAIEVLATIRPILIIECFEISRLNWLKSHGYEITDLREKGNYLMCPRELQRSIVGSIKGIAVPQNDN